MPPRPLPRSFYQPSARDVALGLLGHWLIRNTKDGPCGGPIVETEAYLVGDPACHGAPGPTNRNRVMFGEPGYAYVYFIYGCHYCFNVVCRPAGTAEAVLIRAVEPQFGLEWLRRQRRVRRPHDLTNGPGKICQAFNIDRGDNGADLCDENSPLLIARNPHLRQFVRKRGPARITSRIGLTKAADLPLRFHLASPFVSRR